jgi:cell division protein FtsB
MSSSTIAWIIIWSFAALWFGASAYGHYAQMKSRIAEAEARGQETEAMFFALRDAALASVKANKEALDRAIDRLAGQRGE